MSPLILCLLSAGLLTGMRCDDKAYRVQEPDFDNYLDSSLCDGFDFPVGDAEGKGIYFDASHTKHEGWYIATEFGELYTLGIHPGEDWNGKGGGNTDRGQPVHAIAGGKVLHAADFGSPWGNIVMIEHRYLSNGKLMKVYSVYAHLETLEIRTGEFVKRREKIGTIGTGCGSYPAHLHLEIRKAAMESFEPDYWPSTNNKDLKWVKEHYEDPSSFIIDNRKCLVPARCEQIIIAKKSDYTLKLYREGRLHKSFDIALSQNPERHKQQQGDNRMPEGEYRIIQKSKGPFSGSYAEYFGPAWMRINYPNNYDAGEGLRKKLISREEYNRICKANNQGLEPPKNTKLGGGIGIHGWSGDWPLNFRHLTWGCISMKNNELAEFYNLVELQTPVLILP